LPGGGPVFVHGRRDGGVDACVGEIQLEFCGPSPACLSAGAWHRLPVWAGFGFIEEVIDVLEESSGFFHTFGVEVVLFTTFFFARGFVERGRALLGFDGIDFLSGSSGFLLGDQLGGGVGRRDVLHSAGVPWERAESCVRTFSGTNRLEEAVGCGHADELDLNGGGRKFDRAEMLKESATSTRT